MLCVRIPNVAPQLEHLSISLYTALYEAFFNDAYKLYQQSQFQATPLYAPTKGPLSRSLNSLYNHLTRAGVEDEAALDL